MEPITRREMYLAAAAGYDVDPPKPYTREEVFLAKLAGMDVETPVPYTRRERFIEEAAVAANKAVIEPLTITENGTYTAPEGVDGYNPVTVDVPVPEVKLQDKTITENGEYTADSGFDGLGKVTVDVAGSGGGLTPGVYWKETGVFQLNKNLQNYHFWFNDELHLIASRSEDQQYDIYKYSNGSYVKIVENQYSWGSVGDPVEHNGKVHFIGNSYSRHTIWDGSSFATATDLPRSVRYGEYCVYDGKLLIHISQEGYLYEWDETNQAWVKTTMSTGKTNSHAKLFVINNKIYLGYQYGGLYRLDETGATFLAKIHESEYTSTGYLGCVGENIYMLSNLSGVVSVYRYNVRESTLVCIGTTVCLDGSFGKYLYDGKLTIDNYVDSKYENLAMYEVL